MKNTGGPSVSMRQAALLAFLALILGLAVTAAVTRALSDSIHAEAQARFDGEVRRLQYDVLRRIDRAAFGLHGLAATYAAFGKLNSEKFRDWVDARNIDKEFPGVRGFGMIERVERADLDAFVARMRADEPAFEVRTAGTATDLYVVSEIEPRAVNLVAWGFDLGQERVRRRAFERAIATGELALTDRVSLFQDTRRRAGWLMVLPIFRKGEDPRSEAGRRRALVGLVYAPIIAANVLADVRRTFESQLYFRLYDGPVAEGQLLFDSEDDPKQELSTGVRGGWENRMFRTTRTVELAGQVLTLELASAPEMEASSNATLPVAVALVGALLSMLLALLVWQLASGRRRAQGLADAMTADLSRAARDLSASEAFLEQAQRIANVGGWAVDLETLALRLSAQTLRLFDLPPDSTQTIEQFIGFFVPQSQELIEKATQVAVRDGRPWDLELNLVSASGVSRWVRTVGHVEREGNRSLRLIGTLQDITEQKDAREVARKAAAAKGEFLANTSHELRTPMNAIIGMLALLRNTGLSIRQSDYVEKADGAARSLLGLLNDILDFSKTEAGKLELDPKPFQLEHLLRDLSVILSTNLDNENVEILFDLDPALPAALVGDDMRLRQVMINLGGNAVKFTERGEVIIGVRLLSQAAGRARLEISVKDTGIGIALEQQSRIFEGFSQAETSTVRKYGGTGLGLAISQRLVLLMGGTLLLESEVGHGSRFHFALDLPVPEAAGPVAAPPAKALRALFVDDNPVALATLAALGASLGWTVDTAPGAQEALALVQASSKPYDAIFLDWRMPGIDGLQASELMRRLPQVGQSALLIMVSAHGRGRFAALDNRERNNLDGYLVKPVTASMLRDAVDQATGLEWQAPELAEPAGRPLAGIRLLVVEDNLNNQQIARELLISRGAVVDVAGDGRQAVDRVSADPDAYDLILMDLQMPVMDGYTATRHIRQAGLAELPIVAMTASVMAGDREDCLGAGMQDHIGKPFDIDALVDVILCHVHGPDRVDDRATQEHIAPSPAAPMTRAEVDLPSAVRRLGGDLGFYRRLYPIIQSDTQAALSKLEQVMAQDEREEAGRLFHTMKGLAGTMGAGEFARAAAQGEAAMADSSTLPDGNAVLLDSTRQAFAAACEEIDSELARLT
ncbi:MAG: CHASE domain-containing protein [Ramlibacter sp.]